MVNGLLYVAFGATVIESAHSNKGSIFISNKTVTVSVLSLVPALLAQYLSDVNTDSKAVNCFFLSQPYKILFTVWGTGELLSLPHCFFISSSISFVDHGTRHRQSANAHWAV